MTYFSGFNPCVQTYFPTLGGQGHLKVARWAPPLIFSEDKATSRWRGGPHPSYFRWTRPPQGGEVGPADISYTASHSCTAGVALAGTRSPRDGESTGSHVVVHDRSMVHSSIATASQVSIFAFCGLKYHINWRIVLYEKYRAVSQVSCNGSIDGILRNSAGDYISDYTRKIRIVDVLQAKLWSILIGLHLALNLESNMAVDRMAKLNAPSNGSLQSYTVPPPELSDVLNRDILSPPYLRLCKS
ncbi:hypothetical protein V6N13_045636 [Hibiscus sabdariffa]